MRGSDSPVTRRKLDTSWAPVSRNFSPRTFSSASRPLQHAQAELAIAFDRHDAGVRQGEVGVGLELDALLEVDQVQLDFFRAVDQAPGW